MNPSTLGWIDKFCREFENSHLKEKSIEEVYPLLRSTGFIYGSSIAMLINSNVDLNYSEEEHTKINLITALATIYYDTIENTSQEDFIELLIQFYQQLDHKRSLFSFKKILTVKKSERLEHIIHTRVQTNESLIKKNFSHLLTNALLFIDVLAFENFLMHEHSPIEYATDLEATLTNTVFLALKSKNEKDTYDDLLVKLFASSVRYNPISDENEASFDQMQLERYQDEVEKRYILDLTSLAVWNDRKVDLREQAFMKALGEELKFSKDVVMESLLAIKNFLTLHKNQISFFNYSNPASHFYKQTTKSVSVLILRNKKRLIKEISESKDLMLLLGQSTVRDLSPDEKQRVKQQLLDICKAIPSLAIFVMPGGSLLLPILVKFIPRLLPSAFNENR